MLAGQRSTLGLVLSFVGALMTAVLAALIVFGRRAQKAVYGQMEGQPGAAAGVLGTARPRLDRRPRRSPSTASRTSSTAWSARRGSCWSARATRTGSRRLLTAESAVATQRVVTDTPVHEIIVGNDEGQVPAREADPPRPEDEASGAAGAQITDVIARLKAIDASRPPYRCPRARCRPCDEGHARQHAGR